MIIPPKPGFYKVKATRFWDFLPVNLVLNCYTIHRYTLDISLFWMYEVILFTIGTLVINIIYFVLLDRLMMAAVQRRTGPYNVGYFGLLQSMDDGLKLVKNEVIIPKKSSCILFLVVPNLFFYFSFILWSIIPVLDFSYTMDFTFTIFLQLFLSNLNVLTNISSGLTCNSKYTS